ncbi:MAG TPA: cytochrome c oxidase subunit I [Gemmatimonadaceae bacterium]|nr:cytochrome c oxidase subunit I [Gemmatimonadaceae bacterium]
MATAAAAPALPRAHEYEASGLWSWLTTVDHKRIGALYLYTSLTWFAIGGFEALMIRAQLQGPNGRLVSAETYNQLFTMHGTTMVFLVIMPLSAAFFNLLIPLQIGARDVAFPRLNAFSYWVYLFGSIFMNVSWLIRQAPDAGWFGYTPLTTLTFSQNLNIDFWMLGLQILGVSSLAAAFNFITTIINMRAPGMHFMRMPIFTWMAFIVQFLLVLAFPVITIALVFLQFDRFFGTTFYLTTAGADPLLWQHLFWIFGHPEVYILILPAFGLVSEVLPTFSRKPLFGYPVMVYSGMLIAFLGFGVWAHHMFAVGMGPIADTLFAVTTMLIGIPTGVKIFNWIFTMWGGDLRFTTAMKFGIALVALFTIGGISGVMHASPPADLQQTDTYFIVAHFHYVLFGGSMMGLFAGTYYYYPKFTGRLLSEKLGTWHFWLAFIGMNLTFMPMHWSGLMGMPRRTWVYDAGQGLEIYNLMSSIGAYIQAVSVIIFAYNMVSSRKRGAIAGNDPWGAPTLEWMIPSPPPDYNFAVIPTVTSRYPLWDRKSPQLTRDVPHTREGERAIDVDVGGKHVGHVSHAIGNPPGASAMPAASSERIKSARELGIAMPNPTIKPLFVALFMTLMFASLLLIHKGKTPLAITGVITFALAMTLMLYSWLLTPLEDEH